MDKKLMMQGAASTLNNVGSLPVDLLKERNNVTISRYNAMTQGITTLAELGKVALGTRVALENLKNDRVNMREQSRNVRQQAREETKRYCIDAKLRREKIRLLAKVALETNDPKTIEALARSLNEDSN